MGLIRDVGELVQEVKDILTNHPLLDFNGCSDKETTIYTEPSAIENKSKSVIYASIINVLLGIVILLLVLRLIIWYYFVR